MHKSKANHSVSQRAEEEEVFAQTAQDQIYDVIVIGAGIIGTTIAEKLQYQGRNVLLVDKLGVAEACSKGNAGHFATDIILPLANFSTLLKAPKFLLDPLGPLSIDMRYLPKLLPWLARFAWSAMPHKTRITIEVLKRLNRPSIESYRQLLQRLELERFMSQNGALTIFESKASESANLKHAKLISRHGVNVEVLTTNQVLALEPEFDQQIKGGLFYPDTAHSVDPYQLVVELANSFKSKGGNFLQADVQTVKPIKSKESNCLIRVGTANASFNSKKVIVACGVWSKKFAEAFGYKIPIETERGYHYMLPQPGLTINRPVTCYEKSFVMTPMQQGLRLAGTVELAGLDKAPNPKRAEQLFTNAKPLLKRLNKQNATTWMGHRPSLPDSLPIISKTNNENILFAFGHQHLGLTQAAVTAELVFDLLNSRMDKFLEQQLNINRF